MPLQVVATEELDREGSTRATTLTRCFHCKDELFAVMEKLGAKLVQEHLAYGMNADDTRDFRPGQRAAEQHKVLAPRWLIYRAERSWRCARWPRRPGGIRCGISPAAPCLQLARGIRPYCDAGKVLEQVERGEREACGNWAFRELRVRHHGELLPRGDRPQRTAAR